MSLILVGSGCTFALNAWWPVRVMRLHLCAQCLVAWLFHSRSINFDIGCTFALNAWWPVLVVSSHSRWLRLHLCAQCLVAGTCCEAAPLRSMLGGHANFPVGALLLTSVAPSRSMLGGRYLLNFGCGCTFALNAWWPGH